MNKTPNVQTQLAMPSHADSFSLPSPKNLSVCLSLRPLLFSFPWLYLPVKVIHTSILIERSRSRHRFRCQYLCFCMSLASTFSPLSAGCDSHDAFRLFPRSSDIRRCLQRSQEQLAQTRELTRGGLPTDLQQIPQQQGPQPPDIQASRHYLRKHREVERNR